VMPPDRGMLSTLPSAERLRRAIKTYGMSISGAVLVTLLVGLTSAFFTDEDSLRKLIDNHPRINVVQQDINLQINALNRLNELYQSVGETEDDWSLPWYGPFIESPHLGRIRRTFVVAFRSDLLERVDADITKIASSDLDSDERAYLVSGLVRRINLLTARLEQNVEGYAALAEIPEQYLRVVDPKVNAESAVLFDFLYQEYLQLEQSTVELNDERLRLQAALESVIASSHGNFEWLVIYTGLQGFAEIKVGDFWNGSRQLVDEPFVPSAYTLEGLEFIEKFLDELTLAGGDSASLAAVKEDFMVFYQRNYLKAWIAFADEFDYGKNKLRGRKEWQSAMESMSTVNSPYFSVMRTIQREVEPVYSEGLFNIRGELDYFAEIQEFVGDESGPDNSKAKKKATKAALKVVGKLGNVGKFVAKATKKGLKAKKKLGGKDQEKLDDQLEEAVKIYQSYKTALKDLAFNGDAVKLSYAETSYAFNNPDTRPSGGDGAGAKAWASVLELQRILGRSKGATRLFWNLYDGPVRLAYEYMQEEAACYLQTTWEDKVLGGLEGVTDDKLGESLVGETGLLWDFTSKDAAPFLQKKLNKGYVSKRLGDVSVEWKPEFVEFINSADSGRNIVAGEYEVTIATLPTGINQSAKISPYATFIDLHCADGVQTLSNYNYSASNTFKWSLSNCGDATLRIEAGQYSLRKLYLGQKGFPKFLEDFQDGRRIFTVSEFPGFESQLRNDGVRAIDVNYQIKGQAPVIKMLKAVPLDPPYDVVSCWAD
ncbi:MAG: type VI secretion system protein ImpL, partial [Gammaproteobacteria bacterium]